MPSKPKWTVLTYIAAHNNLAQFGERSLREILSVGSSPEVVHGVLYDGALPTHHAGAAARYVMGEPGLVSVQEQLGSIDSGDPAQLVATARWLFERHPAERYALVLWSHGSGWEPAELEEVAAQARPGDQADPAESRARAAAPGSRVLFRTTLSAMLGAERATERAILFDDGTGHSLDTIELGQVARQIAESVGQPLELLGLDACLMANLEVAHELRQDVRYLVASEELVPGHSWPYQAIYAALRDDPDRPGAALARLVVDRYLDFYSAHPPAGGDVTKVALDLTGIGALVAATDRLAGALHADMEQVANLLWGVQRTTQQRETRGGKRQPSKFDYALWDLGSVAAALAGAATAPAAIRQAAADTVAALRPGGAVLAQGHRGDWFDGIGGASVYLMPPRTQRISPFYARLAFARETRWAQMLAAYHPHFD